MHNHTLLATFRQIFSEKEAGVKDSTAKLHLGDNGDDDGRFKMGTSGRVCVCVKERKNKKDVVSFFLSFVLSLFIYLFLSLFIYMSFIMYVLFIDLCIFYCLILSNVYIYI